MDTPAVLLIEDNNGIAQTIRQCLNNLAYQPEKIMLCHTLSEIGNHSAAGLIAIIIPLPLYDVTTEQVLKIIHHQFPYQPVIIITRKEQEEEAIRAVTCGAEDYIIVEELSERLLQKTINCMIARSGVNYKQLFDESPAPMYIYDKNTFQFLAANEACQKQYGYNVDEFLRMTAEQIRPAEEVTAFRNVSKIIPEEYHDYGKWKHRKKNGEIFTVNIYAHDTQFGNKPARLVTAVDVSSAVLAGQQLQDKNKEVSNILESITDGFFALNRDGEFTYVNKECEKISGLKRGQMIGRNILDVYDRDEYAVFYTQYHQTADKRINMRFEGFVSAIGKWLSVTAYPTKSGLAVYLVDITERRKTREKLYNDGQQLRAIINNTTDMIWLLDCERRIIVGNDAFRQWKNHLTADKENNMLPVTITANWKEHFDIAFGGQALTFTAMETKGDSLFYQEVSLYPVRNEKGGVMSISCFARDVTQQQLRIHKIQLQNEYLEKIAWMHSHDARGPVANILGLASLFEMNDPGDPDNRMMMELIVESSHQLDKVIRKIVADIDAYQLNYGDDED